MGWWSVPWATVAYRLSWCPDDGLLRLYEGGDTRFVIRLGKFDTRPDGPGQVIEGWWDAEGVDGRLGRDVTWLALKFPALAGWMRGRSR